MGAKAGGAVSILVGIVAIIAAIPSGGTSLGAFAAFQSALAVVGGAAMIGVGIYSLAFAPQASNRNSSKSADLQYASAADGVPLPVIFGEQRVVGNFMNYTSDNFRTVKVEGRGGGKGGDSTPASIIGYDYFLTYEYGLCIGPIDEVVQVYGAPGEIVMMGTDPTAVTYSSSDQYKEISLDSIDPTSSNGAEGGIVRLYRGSATQTRIVSSDPYNFETVLVTGRVKKGYQYEIVVRTLVDFTSYGAASNDVGTVFTATNTSGDVLTISDSVIEFSGLNYRNVCWALMIDFKIGRMPQPKSYHFVLRRYPAHNTSFEMLRPDGTAITGFKVRGSADSGKPAYTQANPAAILYECLTNVIWGRGLPQDMFDEASWIAVSDYFASRHIGMSFTIDTQDKIGSIVDGIRAQLKTIMTWDGEYLKLRCLLDITTTHGKIQTLNAAECRSIKVTRPLWHVTTNEIRAEFLNKSKNYRPDSVHVMDLGNRQMTGRINSERIQLNGFIDFNTVRRQAFRILKEKSYPSLSFEIVMNRFKSQLEIGDVFQLQWDEYDQDSTIYCIVTKIDDSDSNSDDMVLMATQDSTLVPASGHEAVPTPPTLAAWEQIPDVDETEIGLWTGQPATSPTGNYPVVVIEIPPALAHRLYGTTSRGLIAVIAHQPAPYHASVFTYVDVSPGTSYALLSNIVYSWAMAGELTMDYENPSYTDRTLVGFTFSLFDPVKDEANLLSMFSLVDTPDQDLEDIVNTTGPFVVIGDEILQVGKIDRLGLNSYRARNIVRGRFGSSRDKRSSGDRVMFMQTLTDKIIPLYDDAGNNLSGNGYDLRIWFKAAANGVKQGQQVALNDNDPFYIPQDTVQYNFIADTEQFLRVSDSPQAPVLEEVTDAGATWTIQLRVILRGVGAESVGVFFSPQEILHRPETINSLDYFIYLRDTVNEKFYLIPRADRTGSFDADTQILTFSGIAKTFRARIVEGNTAMATYTADQIVVDVAANSGSFNGLLSVDNTFINLP